MKTSKAKCVHALVAIMLVLSACGNISDPQDDNPLYAEPAPTTEIEMANKNEEAKLSEPTGSNNELEMFINSNNELEIVIQMEDESDLKNTHPSDVDANQELAESLRDYLELTKSVPGFLPFCRFRYAIERNSSLSTFPREQIIALFADLSSSMNYFTVSAYLPLYYIGQYDGDTAFVEEYEKYYGYDIPMNMEVTIGGRKYTRTALKTLILGMGLMNVFDDYISEGRSFQESDFFLASRDTPIPVVLGSAYQETCKIGQTCSLMYLQTEMNFEVIGFCEPDTTFAMDVAAMREVDIDHCIIMPEFIPMYEPEGQIEASDHTYHIGELLSGYIAIDEPIDKITTETCNQYLAKADEIAAKYDLSGFMTTQVWPVGFVFPE